MMTNLFSAFDPSTTKMISLNWMSTLIVLIMVPTSYWMIPNRLMMTMLNLQKILHKEFKTLIYNNSGGFTLLFISLFMFIMINNMMGLLPYVFTSSSHLVFTMALALPIWMSIILFSWLNKTQLTMAHLIPTGTPPALMPFMVCIETISNMIRPGSLAVRLAANMIAGHLLMSLLGNSMMNSSSIIMPFMLMMQIMLMTFETAVAMIQAYVFSILSTLYTSEVI
uniref:ATP synthase subunit a n=1 Tax=Nerthra indica TaxID=1249914 RepID=C5HIL5_9HEMI|nr:ATP synthase F0 subunit 6 [Nerthra indica]ACJ69460.1 ATP synthase F0 subunit 6 [Nerthra indica]